MIRGRVDRSPLGELPLFFYLVLYINVPYTDYVSKKIVIKNKIIIFLQREQTIYFIFAHIHLKVLFIQFDRRVCHNF